MFADDTTLSTSNSKYGVMVDELNTELVKINWRARSRSHVIDSGYEDIDDITVARAEIRQALASKQM